MIGQEVFVKRNMILVSDLQRIIDDTGADGAIPYEKIDMLQSDRYETGVVVAARDSSTSYSSSTQLIVKLDSDEQFVQIAQSEVYLVDPPLPTSAKEEKAGK